MMLHRTFHLAVALDGTGAHPASWREPAARPNDVFTARYWTDLVAEAERGLLDFVTIDDSLGMQSSLPDGAPDDRTDRVRGRLDAALVAARVAPRTDRIGLIPTAVATHTEPFHISNAIATLDYVSTGRAGWQVAVSASGHEADHFGRRAIPTGTPAAELITELHTEAADYVEVVRRLWDSWEDDAEIRDAATGQFVDRAKLHHIDFEGAWFSVRGPSITPRPPQGQPPVAVFAPDGAGRKLAARSADLIFTAPRDEHQVGALVDEISAERSRAARSAPLHVFADVAVFLDDSAATAADRKARLDEAAGAGVPADTAVFTGTSVELADLLLSWSAAGASGFRLRPGVLPDDLTAITRQLVPHLQHRAGFRREYPAVPLRGLLDLPRPTSRYAA